MGEYADLLIDEGLMAEDDDEFWDEEEDYESFADETGLY